ncbi:NADPH-dependent FMN reductase [Micromonospora sp. NPDC049559]|uniref:NADPH-dependent FMN reductase n=1 Tax=Micromonospora sp. NPDC049559 TaxID=3155923 RepID=UPI0034201969
MLDGIGTDGPRAGHVVLLSGSLSPTSRTDRIAAWCARRCAAGGAVATWFPGAELNFACYRPAAVRPAPVRRFLDALAAADGVVLLSPAYHGTLSGLLKNALDYVNDLAEADQPFLDGRPIGCVAIADGEQGAHSTLATLRTVAHALRGWPTPYGAALSGERAALDDAGAPRLGRTAAELELMLGQVLTGTSRRPRAPRESRLRLAAGPTGVPTSGAERRR